MCPIEFLRRLNKKERIAAQILGEAEDFREYEKREKISCDKGNHKQRSIINQPNHLKFWKKITNDGEVSLLK